MDRDEQTKPSWTAFTVYNADRSKMVKPIVNKKTEMFSNENRKW